MNKNLVFLILVLLILSCNKDFMDNNKIFFEQEGQIKVVCATRGVYQFLISVQKVNGCIVDYYPSNLPDFYTNTLFDGLPISFSANITDSLEQIYGPDNTDIPIPIYKAKKININNISLNYYDGNSIDDFNKCFPEYHNNPKYWYLISDSISYLTFYNSLNNTENECSSSDLPKIDFTKNNLLGIHTKSKCNALIDKKTFIDRINKRYIYLLSIRQSGNCDTILESMNWIQVPKIPTDYVYETRSQVLHE